MAIVDGSLQLGYKDSAWFTANATLVLLEGQIVYLEQTGNYKLGDGVTQLSALTFLGLSAETQTLQAVTDLGSNTTNQMQINGVNVATVNDIPSLSGYEQTVNKSTNVNSDQASNVKYPSVKAVYDWVTSIFVKKGTLTTNAIPKATSSDTIGDSNIIDDGTSVVILSPSADTVLNINDTYINIYRAGSSFSGGVYIDELESDLYHEAKIKLNSPLIELPQLTASQSVETDANKNLVSIRHYTESFAYTGSPFTLTVAPNYIFSIRTTSMVLDESDVNDVTISGTTLTVINPAFQVGETLYIKYKG